MTKNNFTEKENNVNSKNAINCLNRLFYLHSINKNHFISVRNDREEESQQIELPYGDSYVFNCPFNIPKSFAPNYIAKEKKEVLRISPQEKYYDLAQECKKGFIKTSTLKTSLKKWQDNQQNICLKNKDGYKFFECLSKGNARYMKKQYWNIHDFCKWHDDNGYKAYFLTVTCKYELKKDDIIKKWQEFNIQLNETLKRMSDRLNIEYVCVKESFFSGYPHAHIILYTKEYFPDDKQKYLRSKKYSVVVKSKLKNMINKYFTIGFNELVRNDKKGTSNYLSKYISKTETQGLKALINKKTWSKSDRKQALTILLPIIAQVRQFSKSVFVETANGKILKYSKINEVVKSQEEEKEDILEKSLFLNDEDFLKQSHDSGYLITLCNNLPNCIKQSVNILSNKKFFTLSDKNIRDINNENEKVKEKIFKNGKCLSCSGCIMSHFLNYLLTNNDEWFGNSLYYEEIEEQNNQDAEINDITNKILGIKEEKLNNYRDIYNKNIYLSGKGYTWEQKKETYNNTIKQDIRVTPFTCKEYDEINILYDKTEEKRKIKEEIKKETDIIKKMGIVSKLNDIIKSGKISEKTQGAYKKHIVDIKHNL